MKLCLLLLGVAATFFWVYHDSNEPAKAGLSVLDAAVLGIVEGLTEYLPVSSTGHLLFAQELLGLTDTQLAKSAADSYAIIIQFGAILAVAGLYRNRVRQIVCGIAGKDKGGLKIATNIVLAFLPAALAGLVFHSHIKEYLFGPWTIIAAWAAGGILLLIWRSGSTPLSEDFTLESITFRHALLIGLFQCVALWPGMSRSLATIVGGVIVGLPLAVAVEFSFLLGGLTLSAASFYELAANGHAVLQIYDPEIAALGLFFSLVSAAISIKWLVSYLKQRDMTVFGYYRIVLAIAAGAYLLI
ncbi:MAG: undecaprenyl-diphosphate phosphatase [Desulfobulbaceae bacterium]|nr:undecaprenyl-diphosphate phosphatase [Desulfobulbaceae bacterium]